GGAHLTLRTVRVVGALALLAQLADVVRSVARDAAQARGAIAGDRAGVVALPERADERIVAVGVDEATLRQFGQRRTVTRASPREDREDARGEKPLPRADAKRQAQFHVFPPIPPTSTDRKSAEIMGP